MPMKKHPRLLGLCFGATLLVFTGIIWMYSPMAWAGTIPDEAVMVGDETCLDCHGDIGEQYEKTTHGALSVMSSTLQNCIEAIKAKFVIFNLLRKTLFCII